MKTRFGYVSNSSSSSYVILNWKSLDEDKKRMILEYYRYAYEAWKKAGVPIEYNAVNTEITAREQEWGDYDKQIDKSLWFGFIEASPSWNFREDEKDGVLDMWTSMENFEMDVWMDYVGGISYRHTGESMQFEPEEYKGVYEEAKRYLKEIIAENTK